MRHIGAGNVCQYEFQIQNDSMYEHFIYIRILDIFEQFVGVHFEFGIGFGHSMYCFHFYFHFRHIWAVLVGLILNLQLISHWICSCHLYLHFTWIWAVFGGSLLNVCSSHVTMQHHSRWYIYCYKPKYYCFKHRQIHLLLLAVLIVF